MSVYLSYTDEILETHANAGLLRRAKKSADAVRPLADSPPNAQAFESEGCTVVLPDAGIQAATCTCPAHECCKHILSCVLWLREHGAAGGMPSEKQPENDKVAAPDDDAKQPERSSESLSEKTPADALNDALALDPAAILKACGKAGRRLAYALFAEWQTQPESVRIETQGGSLLFHTPLAAAPVAYLAGGGFGGMLSELPAKQRTACHAACLALLFARHRPDAWIWPDDAIPADAEGSLKALSADEMQLVAELRHDALTFVRRGLAHTAPEQITALHLFNMQARAQNLPRLAAAVRRLHGVLKKLHENDVHTDSRAALAELAQFYGYLHALENSTGSEHARLRGHRREYAAAELPDLLPLGAQWWRLPGGAHGLTVCFWDSVSGCLRESTAARANTLDTTFNRETAAQNGIWGSSLDFLGSHRLRLENAKTDADGRISPAPDTRLFALASMSEVPLADYLAAAVRDWRDIEARFQPQSLLHHRPPRYLFIAPASWQPPELNELAQQFDIRVSDAGCRSLLLTIPATDACRRHSDYTDYWIRQNAVSAALVRAEDDGSGRISLTPCSLLIEQHARLAIFHLDYDSPPRPPKKTLGELVKGRIEKMQAQKESGRRQRTAAEPLDTLFDQLHNLIGFYADTGRSRFDDTDMARWQEILHRLNAFGLDTAAQTLAAAHTESARPDPDAFAAFLLKARWILLAAQGLRVRLPLEEAAE